MRKVKNLRRIARRETDAAVRIKRSIFMRNMKGRKQRTNSMDADPDAKLIKQGMASKCRNFVEEDGNDSDGGEP